MRFISFLFRLRNTYHTFHRRKKLTELLTFMKAEVLPEQVGIAVPAEAWGTDVLVLTDEQKAELKALADKLIG